MARRKKLQTVEEDEDHGRLVRQSDGSLEWSYRPGGAPSDYKVRSQWRGASPFFICAIKQTAARLLRVDSFEGRRFMRYFGAYKLTDLDTLAEMHIVSVSEMAEKAFGHIPEAQEIAIGLREAVING